jgi:hypothetical protein
VTTAASSDDSAWHTAAALSCISVIHGVLHRSRRLSPQLAQHVVERGALTHSHDSERSSLCSQRGSLSALCSLRSARSHDFALLASRTRAPLMGGQRPVQRSRNCLGSPRIDLGARTRAACRGIAKWLERCDKRYKKHKESRTPTPPSPHPLNVKNFDCK